MCKNCVCIFEKYIGTSARKSLLSPLAHSKSGGFFVIEMFFSIYIK